MEDNITIQALSCCNGAEERDMLILDVVRNNQSYVWEVFVPIGRSDYDQFLEEMKPAIFAEIDQKEAAWQALDPKTIVVTGIMGEEMVIPVAKSSVVKSENPDYYARRRAEYPSLAEQLDAFWKGLDSPEYVAMAQKIREIKLRHPKP